MNLTADEKRDRLIFEHWSNWLDFSCRCGFPHPKPGKVGPPPTHVEIDGVMHIFPDYPGVMGGCEPVPK